RPALTAEQFVPSPDATEPGRRLYRTGDLVRVLPTGALDFLGRIDRQIKLRGFRIELGEVEAALAELPAVGQALLRLLDDGEPRLVAWVTPAADGSSDAPSPDALSPAALRDALRRQLPAFMVPSAIVVLDAFPLTANGKIDQRALPTPEALSAAEHRPPRNDVEHAIAAVWAEVLGLDRVGLDDDFFVLGGHSLLATRVLSRTRDALGHEVPLTTLFEHPRFEEFVAAASSLRQPAGLEPPPLVRIDDDGPAPTSFSQQRLWFIDQMAPGGTAYHVRIALRLRGALDHDAMRRAVDDLVARHASLRTRIVAVDDAPRQVVDPPATVGLTIENLRGPDALDAATRRIDEASSEPFDLAAGPLARFLLVQLDDQDHALLIVVHHIVTDGESSRILLRELDAAYRAHAAGDTVELPALACRFTDFAAWEQAWLQDEVLDHQLAFWRQHLADAPTVLTIPTDRPRPPVQTFDGAQVRLDLGPERARACQDLARRLGATPFMLLLAGWADLLGRWAGQDQVVLATPVAHRPRTELEDVVGFFANTLPLVTDLAGDPTVDALIGRVRQSVLGAFAHDHLPFEKLVAELDVERDPAFPPIAQATFGLIHDLDVDVRLGELAVEGFGSASLGAKHDLHLELYLGASQHGADQDQLVGSIVYNRDLFEASTIERLGERLSLWLDAVIASSERRRSSIDLRDATDRALEAALIDRRPFRDELTPRQLFETSVDRHGERPALAFDEGRMTYDELEARANRFAHLLIERGVGPGQVVGVLLERSTALVVSLLAIAKADAAYVCLDP
ncbi:MAG: condensation domain-containing protein, partial [Acidobacteriota bacterium]